MYVSGLFVHAPALQVSVWPPAPPTVRVELWPGVARGLAGPSGGCVAGTGVGDLVRRVRDQRFAEREDRGDLALDRLAGVGARRRVRGVRRPPDRRSVRQPLVFERGGSTGGARAGQLAPARDTQCRRVDLQQADVFSPPGTAVEIDHIGSRARFVTGPARDAYRAAPGADRGKCVEGRFDRCRCRIERDGACGVGAEPELEGPADADHFDRLFLADVFVVFAGGDHVEPQARMKVPAPVNC